MVSGAIEMVLLNFNFQLFTVIIRKYNWLLYIDLLSFNPAEFTY